MYHGVYVPPKDKLDAFPPDLSIPGNCSPSDIIEDSSPEPDTEVDEEARLAKRRRIESHARRYLQGQTLYIHSAAIRGPVVGNPWENSKSKEHLAKAKTKRTDKSFVTGPAKNKKNATAGLATKEQQTNLKGAMKASKAASSIASNQEIGKLKEKEKEHEEPDSISNDAEPVVMLPVIARKQRRFPKPPRDAVISDTPQAPRTIDLTGSISIPQASQEENRERGEEDNKKEVQDFFGSAMKVTGESQSQTPTTRLRNTLSLVRTTRQGDHDDPPSPSPHTNVRKSRARGGMLVNQAGRVIPGLSPLRQRPAPFQSSQSDAAPQTEEDLADEPPAKPSNAFAKQQIVQENLGSQAAYTALSPFEFRYTKGGVAPAQDLRTRTLIDEAVNAADNNNNGGSESDDIIPFAPLPSKKTKGLRRGLATISPRTAYQNKNKTAPPKPKAGAKRRLAPLEPSEDDTESEDHDDNEDEEEESFRPPKRARKTATKTTTAKTKSKPATTAKSKKAAPKPKDNPAPNAKSSKTKAPAKPKGPPKPRARKVATIKPPVETGPEDEPQEDPAPANNDIAVIDPIESTPARAKPQPPTVVPCVEQVPVELEQNIEEPPLPPQDQDVQMLDAPKPKPSTAATPGPAVGVVDEPKPGIMSPVSPLQEPMNINSKNTPFPATLPSPLEENRRPLLESPLKPAPAAHTEDVALDAADADLPANDMLPPPSSKLSSPPPSDGLDIEETTVEMSSGRFREALMHSAQKNQEGTEDVEILNDMNTTTTPHVPLNTQAEFLAAANSFNRCLANSPVKFTAETPAPAEYMRPPHRASFTAINSPDRPHVEDDDEQQQARRKLFRTSPLKNNHYTPFKTVDQVTPRRRLSLVGGSQANASFNPGAYSPLTYSPFMTRLKAATGDDGAENNATAAATAAAPGSPYPGPGLNRIESSGWLDDVLGQNEQFLEATSFNLDAEAKAEAAAKTPLTTRKGKPIIGSRQRMYGSAGKS